MIELTIPQAVTAVVAIAGVFVAVLNRLANARNEQTKREHSAMWRKVDGNTALMSALKDELHDRYYKREEIEKFVNLTIKPVLDRLDTTNTSLNRVEALLTSNREYMESLALPGPHGG